MTERIEYLDFDVEVEATTTADAYHVQVLASPKGEASATMTFPFSTEGLENVILKLGRTRSGVRALGSPTQELARTFGTALYDSVFTGEVGTCFRRSLDAADAAGKGLRLRLRLGNAPQLVDVPWEYLYPSGLRKFLVLSRHTPIVRYLDLPREVAPLHVEPPLQVLLVVSAPTDLATLEVGVEVARIQQALADLEARSVVKVTTLQTATLAELRRALRRGTYHVLHFIGHGGFDRGSGEGMLAFEDDKRRAHLVSGTDLATLVQDHRTLRLAMLNACEGARQSPADPFSGVAQALVQNGLPAVVAMQFEITDSAALVLAQEFYSAIADGYPIDAALAEARVAVFSEGNDVEWGTPVLYLRASDGHIFDLAAAPEAGTEAARAGRTVAPDPPEAAAAAHVAATMVIQDAVATQPVVTTPQPVPTAPPQMSAPQVPAGTFRPDSPAAPVYASVPSNPGPVPVPIPDAARLQSPAVPPAWAPPAAVPPGGIPGVAPTPQKRRGLWVTLGILGVAVVMLIGWWVSSLDPGGYVVPTPTDSDSDTASSSTDPTVDPTVDPRFLVAQRGTANIDGVADEWAGSTYFQSDQVVFGDDTGVRGRTQLMWDDNALYFLTEVSDHDLQAPDPDQPSKLYTGDAVSLELGAANADLVPEDKLRPLDRHFMFGIADSSTGVVIGANRPNSKLTTFASGGTPDDVAAHAAATTDGYLVEGMIPWSATGLDGIGSGTMLAANINVSDRDSGSVGKLACMVSTNAERTAATQPRPAYWQVLELQG